MAGGNAAEADLPHPPPKRGEGCPAERGGVLGITFRGLHPRLLVWLSFAEHSTVKPFRVSLVEPVAYLRVSQSG